MGVTGLWTVVQPCARPIKLETLNKKRLAIDASIWIYQFLKAVRDKEGNALRNAHVVGFFRRICKLLYFGIKPVFVFDGGAPVLKRQTITNRKKRREGRREDAARTASKLLTVQLQKKAEEDKVKRRGKQHIQEQEEVIPEDIVYAEEALMSAKERTQNRQFRKKDEYHLPDMSMSLAEMGAPNDPRIMSQEDLEEYARQFHSGDNINLYDFSKIDFESPFFLSLPSSDRYNILNAARLRSRLRMGYSKDQLDTMFPDRMAFSRFQIERVKERNDLTQRLMNLSGMNDSDPVYGSTAASRIAGERNKEYVLVQDGGVEGGWVLGVLGNKGEGDQDKPIDIEQYGNQVLSSDEDEWEDDGFEDVPIEGLNRLPKLPIFEQGVFDESIRQSALDSTQRRQDLYNSRKQVASRGNKAGMGVDDHDDDTLFVPDGTVDVDELFEEHKEQVNDEDEDLRRAIDLSLEMAPGDDMDVGPSASKRPADNSVRAETNPTELENPDSDDNDMDLLSALSKSKVTKTDLKETPHPFDGPLPFEPLRVIKKPESTTASKAPVDGTDGGFEKTVQKKQKKAQPLPPWFSGSSGKKQFIAQEDDDQFSGVDTYKQTTQRNQILSNLKPNEVIDVDDEKSQTKEFIDLESPDRHPSVPASNAPKETMSPLSQDKETLDDPTEICPTISSAMAPSEPSNSGGKFPGEPVPAEERVEHVELPLDDKFPLQAREASPAHHMKSPSPEFEDVDMSKTTETTEAPQRQPPIIASDIQPELQNQTAEFYDDASDYSDLEDQELLHQLTAEAEEHARFASTLNSKSQAENAYNYEQELTQLRSQQKKDRRDADEVSQIMVAECQQLLKLFGLPYITAPMEAEAQCAELVSLGLVDGIVTDDSDVFLFGGTRVYKNVFSQAKYVECYLTSDLEKEYALDRKKLISFAHLLGSDYTEGIPGIGPVTALEILTEFSSLEEFRDWWTQVQLAANIPDDPHAAFRKRFKKNIAKLFLPPSFPDTRVDLAYQDPEVDSDPSAFQWGVPDLNAVRQYLMNTIGWSQERTDEVLVPVIRDVNRREQEGTQSNITGFFQGPQGAGAFAPRRRTDGKSRMEKAFSRLRHEAEAKKKTHTTASQIENSDLPGSTETIAKNKRKSPPQIHSVDDDPENGGESSAGRPVRKTRKKDKR